MTGHTATPSRALRLLRGLGGGLGVVFVYVLLYLVGVGTGVSGLARAEDPYGVVTVDLRPSAGEVPTHVCVVSSGEGPRTRTKLSKMLVNGPGGPRIDVPTVASRQDGRCASGDGACAPRVRVPSSSADDLHIACTEDALLGDAGASTEPRVLTMLLEHLGGSPPVIESLSLTGGVLTVGVRANLPMIEVTARSIGGHYESHVRSYRAEQSGSDTKLVVLPISPRCRTVSLELPGTRLSESDRKALDVEVHGQPMDVERCVAPLRGGTVMRATIPRASAGEGQVRVSLPPRGAHAEQRGDGRAVPKMSFLARWDREWPPRTLALSAQQLRFTWQPPACIWDTDVCPDARLESGIQCTGRSDGQACHYTCPEALEDDELEVTTPVAVTFTRDRPRQSWTEIVQRPGETLTGYVPSDQIYLEADISSWVTSVPGSRVTHVEILGADGSTRRYPVEAVDTLRVLVSGASCEPVRYRLVGDRRYREASAKVRDGEIRFGDVAKTARVLTFNFVIFQGGGPAVNRFGGPLFRDDEVRTPVFFTALVQLAGSFRPRNPKWSRISGELRLGGTVGQWGWYGRSGADQRPRRVNPKVPWMRFLFEPAIAVDVWHGISLSAGLGVGSSWPLRGSDITNTKSFRPILSPSIDARFNVRPWLAFVAQGRVIVGEEILSADFDASGAPEDNYAPATSLLGLYGVQLNF